MLKQIKYNFKSDDRFTLTGPINLIQTKIVLTRCCGSHILYIINNREEVKNNRTLKTRACG